ncbi:MAG: hypothetical protein ACE5KU_00335 [Nitrososphaerales archaeon]
MVWWGCFGGVFIYSLTTILLGGLPLGEGFKGLFDISKATIFLLALVSSFVAVVLPFTLLGRKHLQRMSGARQVVRSAFLRMALAEVAVILGMVVFVATGSYEMYLPFFLMSTLGLLLLKGEEKFYRDVLHTLQEE